MISLSLSLSCCFHLSINLRQVAELLRKRAIPEAVSLIRWVLWILATRLGTLILCGFASFSWKYPFIYKFSEIPAEKREEILKSWSRERSLIALKLAFVVLKIFCFYTFFSLVRCLSYILPCLPCVVSHHGLGCIWLL